MVIRNRRLLRVLAALLAALDRFMERHPLAGDVWFWIESHPIDRLYWGAESVLSYVPALGVAFCDLLDGNPGQAWRNVLHGSYTPMWAAARGR